MTGKVINIHDARIRTISVGIKSLVISDKQVTLAVFRQLWDEHLIDENGYLNGVPWGWVNYHPDKCADYPVKPHWHVVWQKGEELRRAFVFKDPANDFIAAMDYASIRDRVKTDEELARRKRWLDNTRAIAELPQLFVAV